MTAGSLSDPGGPPVARRLSLDYLTVSGATPVEQVEAAAAAGFDSVGLRFLAPSDLGLEHEVVDDPVAVRDIGRACRRLGIRPLDVEVFFLGPDLDAVQAVRAADAAAEIGASMLLAVIATDDRQSALDRFAWLCEVAARNGLDVALEFMRWSPVRTIDEALAFVTDAAQPNAGVCVDTLHLSRSRGRPEQVSALPGRGSFVQLCDAPAALPAADLMRAEARTDRLHPGEGELWLDRLFASIPADMAISVEVPHRRHAERSVMERASIAGEALRTFLARERDLASASTGEADVSADRSDLVVVGGGVFGLSTALEAAGRGLDVVVLDRGRFPDPMSGSVGPSRKLRSTYLEPGYSELVVEAMAAWERLERDTGTMILLRLGNLVYSTHDEHPTLDVFQAASERAGGTIERLEAAELRARFPHFRRARAAIFEPAAGMLRATVGTGAIRTMAVRAGVTILEEARVARLDLDGPQPAAILADGRRMRAPRMVVAAGAWTAGLVPALRPAITLKAQGLAYLHELPASFDAAGFPPFSELETIFYGFPAWGDDPVKIGWHQYGEVTDDPDTPRDEASAPFLAGVRRFLDEHLGLELGPDAIEGATCLYDLTPTTDFVIDVMPGHPAVLVAAGGSGHAFKFGPVLGRIAMDRLDGTGRSWLPEFAWPAAAVSTSKS